MKCTGSMKAASAGGGLPLSSFCFSSGIDHWMVTRERFELITPYLRNMNPSNLDQVPDFYSLRSQ